MWTVYSPPVSSQRHWRYGTHDVNSQFWEVFANECQLWWHSLCFTSGWGYKDEIKWGLSCCCSSCKMGLLSAFLCLRTLFPRQLEVRQKTITILERGILFFCCFLESALVPRQKVLLFQQRLFHRLQSCACAGVFGKTACCPWSQHLENFSSSCCIPWAMNP